MIDLDKAKAARAEAAGTGPIVKVGGVEYQLPAEMPFGVLAAFRGLASGKEDEAAGALVDAAEAILGEHYPAIRPQLSLADLDALITGVLEEYGVGDQATATETASA